MNETSFRHFQLECDDLSVGLTAIGFAFAFGNQICGIATMTSRLEIRGIQLKIKTRGHEVMRDTASR